MGDYNAEPTPNAPQASVLAWNYSLIPLPSMYFDEWNIDANNRVTKFCSGDGIVNVKIKSNPSTYPA